MLRLRVWNVIVGLLRGDDLKADETSVFQSLRTDSLAHDVETGTSAWEIGADVVVPVMAGLTVAISA